MKRRLKVLRDNPAREAAKEIVRLYGITSNICSGIHKI
jgi:hypothetical protein